MVGRFTKNFIPLFNAFWYRDFPLVYPHKLQASRAQWTTHIGICVRSCADALGYFTEFESGIRTDAIITNNIGRHLAHVEWEWNQPIRDSVNEVEKLYQERDKTEASILITYSDPSHHDENLLKIERQWKKSANRLLVFLVTFERRPDAAGSNNGRQFLYLETYRCREGKLVRVRRQPALPWDVTGTRWESSTEDRR